MKRSKFRKPKNMIKISESDVEVLVPVDCIEHITTKRLNTLTKYVEGKYLDVAQCLN